MEAGAGRSYRLHSLQNWSLSRSISTICFSGRRNRKWGESFSLLSEMVSSARSSWLIRTGLLERFLPRLQRSSTNSSESYWPKMWCFLEYRDQAEILERSSDTVDRKSVV